MENKLAERLIADTLALGAHKAHIITTDAIETDRSFRDMCAVNACGVYGKCWMCPPHIGQIGDLMDRVRAYPKALWYQSIASIEDSYDIEGMFAAGEAHAWLSQRIQAAVSPLLSGPFLHLGTGGCHLCPVCAKATEEPCRMPDKALSSLEGYGVDVYNTTKDTALQYINGQNTVTYFGMVLFSE